VKVLKDAEQGDGVLYVSRVHELQASVLHERDVAGSKLQFEEIAVMSGPEQHGLTAKRRSPLTVLQQRSAHRIRLGRLVETRHQDRPFAVGPSGPERLFVPLGRQSDHRVRRLDDGRGRTVVALEPYHRRSEEAVRELEDVANRRAPERVDGLGVVADHGDVLGPPGEPLYDVGLQLVGVLILVDKNVVEQARHSVACRPLHEGPPVQEEVVVVEDVLGTLALHVGPEDAGDGFGLLLAPREVAPQNRRQLGAGVHGPRVDGAEGGLAREAALACAEAQVATDQVEQVGRVGLVQHREVGGDADGPAVQSKQPIPEGVEGAAPHPAADTPPHHQVGPGQHLLGRPAGEGQEQDPLGTNAALDKVGDPTGECEGLPAPGTGHDQERTPRVADGSLLLPVQFFGDSGHAFSSPAMTAVVEQMFEYRR
jgi:hypothetical protein